jgi:hypothetical protein
MSTEFGPLRVTVNVAPDMAVQSGTLLVKGGQACLTITSGVRKGETVCEPPGSIQLNVTRFPPWYSSALFLAEGSGGVVIGLPRRQGGRVAEALRGAGYDVKTVRRTIFTLLVR